ncbi:unnamed protein product [Rangifer tarandus platyrhynchus]|uniref:Uncharacterized protein n=2 Tax=Rangifer tarandus platyrhynchus TaxID=3082113 RepID=A0ABN8ZT77_RANTA|nr:unnamed protein product [Rangifer tarandus platyrhynchus]
MEVCASLHVPEPPRQMAWPSSPAQPALALGSRVSRSGRFCLPCSGAAPPSLLPSGCEDLQKDLRPLSPLWGPRTSVDETRRLLSTETPPKPALCFLQTDREPWRMDCSQKGRQNKPQHCVAVQSLSRVRLFVTPWTAARQASLSFTISQSWLQLKSTESVMPSNHLILCRPLLLPSIFCSNRVFSNESALHIRWPKYWSFSISPSTEYSGLISFRMDWLNLPEVQGTLQSLFQHYSLKASTLQRSAFVMIQLSHPHLTSGKTIV